MTYLAYGALVALLGMLLWLGATRKRGNPLTRKLVYDNLEHAWGNAHFEEGGYLHGWTAADIAYDLTCDCPDCGNLDPGYLEPYVRDWLYMKGLI